MKPYFQLKLFNIIFRVFYSNNKSLYKWHYDEKNRVVFAIPLGKFKFQFDNKLPFVIKWFGCVVILKGEYHRIIKDSGILLTLIIED